MCGSMPRGCRSRGDEDWWMESEEAARSAIVEVYPSLWNVGFAREDRNQDQHDAYSVAAWLSNADIHGGLTRFLNPPLSPADRATAQIEGWILGIL